MKTNTILSKQVGKRKKTYRQLSNIINHIETFLYIKFQKLLST